MFCIKLEVMAVLLYYYFIIDIPGKPGVPEIVDWDVDRVDLKWDEPTSNGGAPITGYIIEKKEKFSPAWSEILTTKVSIRLLLHKKQSSISQTNHFPHSNYQAKSKSFDSADN